LHYSTPALYVATAPNDAYVLYIIILSNYLLNAAFVGRILGQLKQSMILFGATFFIIVAYDAILNLGVLHYYLSASSLEKSAIRVILIPGIFVVVILLVRYWVRKITLSKDAQYKDYVFLLAVLPGILKVFYMRILYSSISLQELVWNTILACFLDLLMKLLHWNRGIFFTRIGISKETAPAALFELPAGDESYAKWLCLEKAIDITGIWYATTLQILHGLIEKQTTPFSHIIAAFFIQYAIELVVLHKI